MMTSPRLMPIRSCIFRASGTAALRASMPCCISIAHCTACTTLANSPSTPALAQHGKRSGLVLAHEPGVADHIGGENRGEAAFVPGFAHCAMYRRGGMRHIAEAVCGTMYRIGA